MCKRRKKVITLNRVNFHPVYGVQFRFIRNDVILYASISMDFIFFHAILLVDNVCVCKTSYL